MLDSAVELDDDVDRGVEDALDGELLEEEELDRLAVGSDADDVLEVRPLRGSAAAVRVSERDGSVLGVEDRVGSVRAVVDEDLDSRAGVGSLRTARGVGVGWARSTSRGSGVGAGIGSGVGCSRGVGGVATVATGSGVLVGSSAAPSGAVLCPLAAT